MHVFTLKCRVMTHGIREGWVHSIFCSLWAAKRKLMTVGEFGNEKIGSGGVTVATGYWNDDEVTQEPHSRIYGFSLLAINSQSTRENWKLCSQPIRAKCVYLVCMCACMCVTHIIRDQTSSFQNYQYSVNAMISCSHLESKRGTNSPKRYTAFDVTNGIWIPSDR